MSDKVTLASIVEAIDGYDKDEYIKITLGTEDSGTEVLVKKWLTLSEKRRFIDAVADMCFVEDSDGNLLYCPYLKDFSFAYHTALFFTNIELTDDIEEIYKFLKKVNIVTRITDAGGSYLDDLCDDVNKVIEFRKNELLNRSKLDNILGLVAKLIKDFDAKFEGESGESIMKYLEGIIPNFKEEMTKVFQEQQETKSADK